jgi:Putative beta-barrel porin-2, OmpL-like. bbp2
MIRQAFAGTAMALALAAAPARAEDAPATPPAPPTLSPALAGPLAYNPNPLSVDVPSIGKIYITGIGSGLVGTQSNSTPGVRPGFADVSNAEVIIQKADGVFQFLVQAGLYNQETLGTPLARSTTYTDGTYGPVPQAWAKIAPSANFNVQVGILPTLIGLEAPFTFQNLNIDRGILWGQENVLTRAVQANLTVGKAAFSLSFGDGFFSGKYNWLSGTATYNFNASNILTLVAGGALTKNYRSTFGTPIFQNNSSIYNVIYTYTKGPILIQPYFQYTHVPSLPLIGTGTADSYSGAVLARYTVSPNFSVPVRFEYISTTGTAARNSPSLIYGTGSKAFTFTITPTYTFDRFFIRPEFSIVSASSITPGFGFGRDGLARSQARGRLEFGVLF